MFQFRIILFLLTNTVSSLIDKTEIKTLRFFKGVDIEDGDFPFVIVLAGIIKRSPNSEIYRIGAGTLVTETWVLTAAHIFKEPTKEILNSLIVWYGEFTKSPFQTNKYSEVIQIIKHPAFRNMPFISDDLFYSINDIALLHVNKVTSPAYGRLSSVNRDTLIGLSTKYIGVGETDKPGDDIYRKLQLGGGLIVKCGPPISGWSPYLLCVTPTCLETKQQGRYSGDSGAPLLVDDKIVGILSMNFFIHTSLAWTAFTPVDLYLDWVYNVIKQTRKELGRRLIDENFNLQQNLNMNSTT